MEVKFRLIRRKFTVRKVLLLLAAALCMSTAVPVSAEMTAAQKDECVLASRNCSAAVDDIQTKVKRINKEIDKGTRVYSPAELKKLQEKLEDIQAFLRDLEKH
jgi:Skp family chaperone for outer membrane proteins